MVKPKDFLDMLISLAVIGMLAVGLFVSLVIPAGYAVLALCKSVLRMN